MVYLDIQKTHRWVYNLKVIITGGGTGGHIYPALAIAHGLKSEYPDCQILYVGTKRGLEAKLVPKEKIKFEYISVEGLPRRINFQSLKSGLKLIKGLGQSFKIVTNFKPDVIISTGGYVAGPVAWVGAQRGVPLVIHEQNSLPGITNRILGKSATKICLTYEDSKKYFKDKSKIKVTGLPIRSEILKVSREEGIKKLGLDSNKKTVLITGGSRGARTINMAVVETIRNFMLNDNLQIIFITGEVGYEETIEQIKRQRINTSAMGNITIKPYLHNMEYALAAADLVVGRAGATFLAEITAIGIPAILIPYPFATENHQEHNAMSLVKAGAAIMVKDNEFNGSILYNTTIELISDTKKLETMKRASIKLGKPQALDNIIKTVIDAIH